MKTTSLNIYSAQISSCSSSESKPSVKILVGYHKPAVIIQSDIFTPIHLGRAIEKSTSKDGKRRSDEGLWLRKHILVGDDTGDNISEKYSLFKELTAIYWAWKNYEQLGNPDYIGFMLSDRHLCFDLTNTEIVNDWGVIFQFKIDENYLQKYHFEDNKIQELICNYDLVVSQRCNLDVMGAETPYKHHGTCWNINYYDCVLDVLKKQYPEYVQAAEQYNNGNIAYFSHCFILRKELFFQYAEWLFSILFEVETQIKIDKSIHYSSSQEYISKYLFPIWFTHLKNTINPKILELKRLDVYDTRPQSCNDYIFPAFKENNIAIAFATNADYIPYLAVCIYSLIHNSSDSNNYDILILHSSLSENLQYRIIEMERKNVSIRFINIEYFFQNRKDIDEKFFAFWRFSKETFYRLCLPTILTEYEKILYLDCDVIVNKDVADLFMTELSKKDLLAGVQNDFALGQRFGISKFAFKNETGCGFWWGYVNAGVLLMNLSQWREENILEKCLLKLDESKLLDQALINIVCKNRIKLVDVRWNGAWGCFLGNFSVQTINDRYPAIKDSWILHFAGERKPWKELESPFAFFFWRYARMSSFYEEIYYKNYIQNNIVLMREVYHFKKNRFIYNWCRIFSNITFGKMRKYYEERRKKYKEKVQMALQFIKEQS